MIESKDIRLNGNGWIYTGPNNIKNIVIATGGNGGGYINGPDNIYYSLKDLLLRKKYGFLRVNVGGSVKESSKNLVKILKSIFKGKKLNLTLIGWSFGAAVVIEVALMLKGCINCDYNVKSVISLAGQYNEKHKKLKKCLVLYHCYDDDVLPMYISNKIYQERLDENLRIVYHPYQFGGHIFRGLNKELYDKLYWNIINNFCG